MSDQVMIVVTPKGEYVSFTEVESAAAKHHIHVSFFIEWSFISFVLAGIVILVLPILL